MPRVPKMNVDKRAREELVFLLELFINGRITNFDFEERLPSTQDKGVNAVIDSVWCLYDDFKEHTMRNEHELSSNEKNAINRWILFLKTDLVYDWPIISYPGVRPLKVTFIDKLLGKKKKEDKFMENGSYKLWPFKNSEDYNKAKDAH